MRILIGGNGANDVARRCRPLQARKSIGSKKPRGVICNWSIRKVCFCGSLPALQPPLPAFRQISPEEFIRMSATATVARRIVRRSTQPSPARDGAAVRTPPVRQQLRRAVARRGRAGPRDRRLQSAAPPPVHHVRRNAGGDQVAGLLAIAAEGVGSRCRMSVANRDCIPGTRASDILLHHHSSRALVRAVATSNTSIAGTSIAQVAKP